MPPSAAPDRGVVLLNALATRGGGALTRVQEVARRAPRLWDVELLLVRTRSAPYAAVSVEEVLLPAAVDAAPGPFRRVFEAPLLKHACRTRRVRVILHYGTFVPLARSDAPQVLCFTNLGPWDPGAGGRSLRNRILRRAFERTAVRAHRIVVESGATRNFLLERYPALADRVTAVRNGVRVPRVRRGAARDFVVVGDILPYRRVPEVVRAYAGLPEGVRSQHGLVLVGTERDPAECRRVREAAQELGVAGSLRMTGRLARTEMLTRVASSCAFVSWSGVENGPNAVLEAVALEAPMVLSDLPVHREYAADAATYAADLPGLTAALAQAAAQASVREERSDVGPLDSWDEHVQRVGDVLEEIGVL